MRIQSHLFVLALGVVAPLLVVLAAGGIVLWKSERESLVRESTGRTRAAMSAIDTELRGSITALKVLAANKSLEAGDIRAFHNEAQRMLAIKPQWRNIGLATVGRVQLMDAIRPYGEHAHFANDETFDRLLQNGEPAISGLSAGTAFPTVAIRVTVPVIVNGAIRYVLSASIDPANFDALLRAQRLPEGWVIALVDRNKKVIARIPSAPAGALVSTSFQAAIARAPQGWFSGRTLEGSATYTPYVTSELSGWVLGIAMPAQVVEAGPSRAVWVAAIGALVALAIAFLLAWLIAQRIAGPIAALASAADDGLDGEMPRLQPIDEIARLQSALRHSSHAVRERQQRLEVEQAALQRQTTLLEQRTDEAETLMQVMPIAVFKTEDPECRIVTANPAGYRFLNLPETSDEEESVLPETWQARVCVLRNGRELAPAEWPMPYSIAHGVEVPGEELEFRFADGFTKFGYVYASPLFNARGDPRGSVCAILDISDRKEDDLRKDEFLATLAHELRNPLASTMNALHLLHAATDDPAATASARQILDRQIRHMKRLIDDLMDVSRISRGKLVLQREQIELKSVVDEVVDTCRPALDAKGHHLEINMPASPLWLNGDPARLVQLLSNLVGNACKFTPQDGRVRLALTSEDTELLISVSDNGMGIAPAALPYVFDLFVQGDRSLERSADGLGIGLSLVQRLTQMHGGTVEAHSDGVGQGAEFTVRLPIVVGPQQSQQPAAQPAHGEGTSLRILVVDDNRDAAASLATLLTLSGHGVEIAHDGMQALHAAERFRPQVILMDIGMPVLNGYDAARLIRDQPWGKDLKLVAISGWGQEADRQNSMAAGFSAHLVKPVEFAALTQVLAAVPSNRTQV